MIVKRRFQGLFLGRGAIFAGIFLVVSSSLFAQSAEQSVAMLQRYRVFALKHISGQEGKKYLEAAEIGTVSQLPGSPNTLLVTAQPPELIKATTLINLVDSEKEFVIETVCSAEANNFPPIRLIEKTVGNISIGTFSDPPLISVPARAVVDIHKDRIIAIAPAEQIEKIVSAVRRLYKNGTQVSPLAQSDKSVVPQKSSEAAKLMESDRQKKTQPNSNSTNGEGDDFFNKLLNELAEAEKKAVEKTQQPNQPGLTSAAAAAQKPQEQKQISVTAEIKETVPQPSPAKEHTEPSLKPTEANILAPGVGIEPQHPAIRSERMSYEPEPSPLANEDLELNLPEKLDVRLLLDLVKDYMNVDCMYDETKVSGEVTLKLRGPIKVKELYPLVESVMKFKGLVMSRKGNLVTIVPQADVMEIDPALLKDGVGKIQYGDVVVTKFFDLQYLDTTNAKNLLDGMKLSVNVTPIPETGTLIVTGFAYRMGRIEELLSIIDRPGPPRQFRFRQLKYTMANVLAPKVKALVEQLGDISITVATPTAAPAQPTPRAARRPQPQPGAAETAAGGRPTVYLDADERTNRILMIGFDVQLDVVEQLITALDVEKQDLRILRLYDMQHVGAEEVKAKLSELGIIGAATQPAGTAAARIIRPRPEEAVQAAPAASAATALTGLAEEPQVVVIESTNSLLVNATAEQHTQIAVIIGYVDTVTLEQAIPYEIYALENQDPKDLAEVLTKLIQETIRDKEGKVEKIVKKQEEEIVIVPDENTFSIIVYASRKNQEWIKKLITSLDRRRPQVLIDLTLVEVTRTESFEYDLDLVTKQPHFNGGGTMESVSAGSSIPLVSALVSPFPLNVVREASSKSGTATIFYSDEHIQALLTAMQSKKYGRILAKPKVLVDDGSEGIISTIDETVYKKSTQQVPDQGGAITTTEYVPITATIQLKITPHISEGELLRLDVGMKREDFGTRAFTDAPPDKATSEITTTVFVPDDHTVILGGLVKLNQTKGGSKVPLLGDIPIVGMLFRTVDNTDIERKLYVFLKANIVRPSAENRLVELEDLSEKHRDAFETFEGKFQEYDEIIPGCKPNPMPPSKVLDEL